MFFFGPKCHDHRLRLFSGVIFYLIAFFPYQTFLLYRSMLFNVKCSYLTLPSAKVSVFLPLDKVG